MIGLNILQPEETRSRQIIDFRKNSTVGTVLHMVLLGLISAFATTIAIEAIAAWDGVSIAPDSTTAAGCFVLAIWISAQSLCLIAPAVGVSFAVTRFIRAGVWTNRITILTAVYIFVLPVFLICDSVAFGWTGQRLFSLLSTNTFAQLPALIPFASSGSLVVLAAISAGCVLIPAVSWIGSCWLVARMQGWSLIAGSIVAGSAYVSSLLFAVFTLSGFYPTLFEAMEHRACAHPFYVFGLMHTPNTGPEIEVVPTEIATAESSSDDSYQSRQRRLRIAQATSARPAQKLPDVVVVVIESLRPELIQSNVMPNLASLSKEGIHCKYHFSGGNATNHGMFSLITGLEPIWFDTAQRFDPGMYRWFKSLGYEIGFFAGADDWATFEMDGFIRKKHFDEFETSSRNGIASDRRAVDLASSFLSRDSNRTPETLNRGPRLAIVYVYGTHATYQSYSEDQLDQPAADNRYPFPYPARMRDSVWNRYRNSARTVDRLLKPLLSRDRVIVAVGDHGESFLEDGTIGHGIRLSRYQNMTAAVMFCPGKLARVVELPTSHTDVLPTLFSYLGVDLSDAGAIDGTSLELATDRQLADRRFATRNYLEPDYALIGPWTQDPSKPFAFRFKASVFAGSATELNAIDEVGLQVEHADSAIQAREVKKWQASLTRTKSETNTTSKTRKRTN
ncbi:sulfatase-like hydrolase/transferase [Rhodopirellula sp.]|nr:sulfatase-like hydrolase/transferase [Rhodopirellula sp.]